MTAFARVRFTAAALDDLRRIAERDRALVVAALKLAARVDRGETQPTPLRQFSKTGNLSDCAKAVFGLPGSEDSHRMVFQHDGRDWRVLAVIVVEERTDDIPYLLAGLRLGRITDPVARGKVQRRLKGRGRDR